MGDSGDMGDYERGGLGLELPADFARAALPDSARYTRLWGM